VKVRPQRRSSASLDDHMERIRQRIKVVTRDATDRLERLRRFQTEEGLPRTHQDFARLAIQLELAHAAVAEAAEAMR
jgi:hypothetical protein